MTSRGHKFISPLSGWYMLHFLNNVTVLVSRRIRRIIGTELRAFSSQIDFALQRRTVWLLAAVLIRKSLQRPCSHASSLVQ